uniref:NADH-ubiquinone oxidoreductase chain 4 n=1 Tax=Crangonyx forbesi TaxID=111557 RepID=A0A6C0X4Y9_9CRUS|nr:NADH dehydrogenase subunit 4 [Crangonyx forbesi]
MASIFSLIFSLFFILFSGNEVLMLVGFGFWFFFLKSYDFCENSSLSSFGSLDFLGWGLIALSFWIVLMSLLSSLSHFKSSFSHSWFSFLMVFLLLMLIFSFYVKGYLQFYIFFESSFIPVLLMILGWGYQPERSGAGLYMMFYTLVGSLPLLIVFLMINFEYHMNMMSYTKLVNKSFFIYFLMFAFLIKFPMYLTHLWLPKAHLEAPLAGSMLLAGVLLKLGGYGLVRVLPLIGCMGEIMSFIICVSLWGGVCVSLICLRQFDMKLIIAYSSVVHMSGCISGLMVMSDWGLKGCMILMVGHGLCSSGLFYLANCVYIRTGSRSMLINKGLLSVMPSLSLFWFLLLSVNMASPPSINLLGEIMLMGSVLCWCQESVWVLFLLGFLSVTYSLYLFSFSQHGGLSYDKKSFNSGVVLEYLIVLSHWAPSNLLILMSSLIS